MFFFFCAVLFLQITAHAQKKKLFFFFGGIITVHKKYCPGGAGAIDVLKLLFKKWLAQSWIFLDITIWACQRLQKCIENIASGLLGQFVFSNFDILGKQASTHVAQTVINKSTTKQKSLLNNLQHMFSTTNTFLAKRSTSKAYNFSLVPKLGKLLRIFFKRCRLSCRWAILVVNRAYRCRESCREANRCRESLSWS